MEFGKVVSMFLMAASILSAAIMSYFYIKSLDNKAGENNEEKNKAYTEKIQTLGALAIAFAFVSAASLIIFPA